jgi:uncharacterized protein YjbJ (UPF0337 family)
MAAFVIGAIDENREHLSPFCVHAVGKSGREQMDWNRVEGNWKEVQGKVKQKWAKLTDDDLTAINGQRQELEGRLQKRYGYAKDQARKDVDDWFSTLT